MKGKGHAPATLAQNLLSGGPKFKRMRHDPRKNPACIFVPQISRGVNLRSKEGGRAPLLPFIRKRRAYRLARSRST